MQKVSRLYEQFVPDHYTLSWDLRKISPARHIDGTVSIRGRRSNPDSITLHAKDLEIESIRIDNNSVTTYQVNGDELVIEHKGSGMVTIDIAFSLTASDAMHGIYPCYYNENGTAKEIYATQFESHHAREGFPCVDEPEAKATFDITLTTSPDVLALGNMPTKDQMVGGNSMKTIFDTTPRMSTYLVAFAVGDFQRATNHTKNGVEVNVYATKVHTADSLDFALSHATKVIDFFDEYFGVPYPLPKSDHVALPDFSSGAMENWGLVTYREIALLADPRTTGISTKQYVSEVIAHELSHQWFGNLVTMKWWDNLWLNESFATIMGYLAPSKLYPEWNLWFDFSTSEGVMALRRDCIDGVQSVEIDVNHPDEISALFDPAIVYAKGGRLIHMMQTYVGEEAFRTGLHNYFMKFQYGNTTGNDLWDALSDASGKDIRHLMTTWITQGGYPVVHASLENNNLTLSQERFFVGPHQPSNMLWPVPLRPNSTDLPELLSEMAITVPYTSSEPLHLNADDSGHYIVHYDDTLRARILDEIASGSLSDIQRAQFLHEQTLLARGGYMPSEKLVELLAVYGNESNERVWDIMALTLSDLKRFVEDDKLAEQQLRSLSARLARTQHERLGWEKHADESEDDTKLRATIIGFMVYGEDEHVIERAIEYAQTTPLEELQPELRSLILGAAVKYGSDRQLGTELLAQYKQTTSADIQSDITAAVTSTQDKDEITHIISLLMDKKVIRHQDLIRWFVCLLRNRESRSDAWEWMKNNWSWIDKTFSSDKSHDYFPRYTASILGNRHYLAEYRDFFTPLRDLPSLQRSIDMGLLDLEGKVDLIERDAPAVIAALQQLP